MQVTKKILTLEERLLGAADRWEPLETGKVCREALARIKRLEQGLMDVLNPMQALQREAECEDAVLNRMAPEIAASLGCAQQFARDALEHKG